MANIIVGKILSAHGIRGEVKVKPLSDNPRRFRRGDRLWVEKEEAYFTVASAREAKDGVLIVRFRETADRDGAEKLKTSLLLVGEEDAAPLPEGTYYHFQLLGLAVRDEDGADLGVLAEIIESGSNDVYRVDCGDGTSFLLPGLKEVVRAVDLENGVMTVRLLPGLKEACAYHER
ncbi:MAG: ribosome maturation factor RimM [Bacillota bacterium]|jgi:16S rRNA processing protein RimM